MTVDNYYEILGIDPSADENTIRGAVRKARSRYRQVAGSPNKEQARNAEVMIEKLAEAEKFLLDPEARKGYDAQLTAQPRTSAERTPTSGMSTNWIDSAKAYLANGQPRNAAQAAKEATRAEPHSADAWTVRAYAALELRDFHDADFSASEAQRCDPDNPQILGLMGAVADGEGRYADAQRAFTRAAELEPTNPYWFGRVVWAMGDQGDYGGAIAYARQCMAHFPGSDYLKNCLALQLLREADGALSQHPQEGAFFTNKRQIVHFEQRIAEVEALRPLEGDTESALAAAKSHLAIGKRRRFVWPGVGTFAVYLVGWLVLILISASLPSYLQFLVFVGATVGVGWMLFNKVLPTQWSINKKALGALAKTGIQ